MNVIEFYWFLPSLVNKLSIADSDNIHMSGKQRSSLFIKPKDICRIKGSFISIAGVLSLFFFRYKTDKKPKESNCYKEKTFFNDS